MAYEEERTVQHQLSGSYDAASLLPQAALDLNLEQVLTLLVAKIIDQWEELEIVIVNADNLKVIEFKVPSQYKAQVLGRDGRTIRALRTIMKAILGPMVKQCSYYLSLSQDQPR